MKVIELLNAFNDACTDERCVAATGDTVFSDGDEIAMVLGIGDRTYLAVITEFPLPTVGGIH